MSVITPIVESFEALVSSTIPAAAASENESDLRTRLVNRDLEDISFDSTIPVLGIKAFMAVKDFLVHNGGIMHYCKANAHRFSYSSLLIYFQQAQVHILNNDLIFILAYFRNYCHVGSGRLLPYSTR
jgi:hypothetical protein